MITNITKFIFAKTPPYRMTLIIMIFTFFLYLSGLLIYDGMRATRLSKKLTSTIFSDNLSIEAKRKVLQAIDWNSAELMISDAKLINTIKTKNEDYQNTVIDIADKEARLGEIPDEKKVLEAEFEKAIADGPESEAKFTYDELKALESQYSTAKLNKEENTLKNDIKNLNKTKTQMDNEYAGYYDKIYKIIKNGNVQKEIETVASMKFYSGFILMTITACMIFLYVYYNADTEIKKKWENQWEELDNNKKILAFEKFKKSIKNTIKELNEKRKNEVVRLQKAGENFSKNWLQNVYTSTVVQATNPTANSSVQTTRTTKTIGV